MMGSEKKGYWQEPQEEAQSLPRLRNQKSEDAFLRRTSRESKTRSLSYSELEFPAPSFIQRFGSLTWRKKRFSTFEYGNASPNISSPTELQWSVGRLERPAVGSELDLERRHPKSCIVQYPFAQSTPKIFEHCSKQEQMNLEMSTSFDFIADDDGNSSIPVSTKGKNVQLPFAFPERLGEDEDSLPCWAETVLNDYMPQDQQTPGSPIYPLSGDSQSLEFIDQCEDPDQYRSPLYHRIRSKNLMLEESFIKESKVKNSLTQKKAQTKDYKSKNKEETEIITKRTPRYNRILSQDPAQIKTDQKCVNLSSEEPQNSSPSSQGSLRSHTEFAKLCGNRTSLAHTNDTTKDELQKETKELQDPIEDQTQNLLREFLEHESAQRLSDSSTLPLSPPMENDCKSQASPNTARMRYEVIITMTKEEKEQAQLQRLAQEMVKAEELVGQDLRMSPSLESQASGYHRAGLTEVTAQDISETSAQTEKNTTREEEISERKGGETPKRAQLDRSIGSALDEKFVFTNSRSDWVAESCRLQLTKMEKPDNQQKSEFPRKPIEKNVSTKLSHGVVSPHLYVGHVKGLQKVFENISSKDDVIHHKVTAKSQQYGSLRQKRHKVPQDAPVSPGVHGPVFSTVYNPFKKDPLKKGNEQVTVTVIENTGNANTSTEPTVSQSNMDSNRKNMESKSTTKKYIANVELTNICHSDYEDNYRKVKKQHPDLKLPPRTTTPPPYRTKNNSSISLSSPRGWKNESVIVRSPLASAHKCENQRNNSSPMPSQISHNFFFSEGNDSCAKIGLETNQNVKMFGEKPIHSRDLTKHNHSKNSQESYKAELKLLPQVTILHDVSHIVDGKEALHNRNFEKFANTKNNDIQKDPIANVNLEAGEMQEVFTGTFLAERMLIDDTPYQETSSSEIVKSRGKEVNVDEIMTKVDSKLSHDILPIMSQRRKPPSFTYDASIKLENTHREKHSNEFKNHNASRFMDINYTKGDSKGMPHENRNRISGDLRTSKEAKSKYQPSIIHSNIVDEERHDSIHLNKRANDEFRHFEGSVSDQPLDETNTRLKHKVEELKKEHGELPHWDYSTKNNLKCNTIYLENQSDVAQPNNPATDQSEEKVLFVTTEGKHIIHVETDIMRSANNNEERKTDLADRVGGAINHLPLNKAIAESYIEQTEMDIPEGDDGVSWKQSIYKKEKDRNEEGSKLGYNYRNEKARKDKELNNQEQLDIISMTAADRQTDDMNKIDEESRVMGTHSLDILVQSKHEIAELRDQPHDIVRAISSLDEDRSKYEQNDWSSEVLSTKKSDQGFQMDLNLNVCRDVMDHGRKFTISVEREMGQMENVWEIPRNTTAVKNIVNMIEEKTDEVDISTVAMRDQSILDATVTKDESVSNTIYLFASDSSMTVNTEVEESNELLTDAEYNEEQAASDHIVLVDSSRKSSEQSCNNLKEDPDTMLSTSVNGSHLSKTHVHCENSAQANDVTVNHNLQNADHISEHHKNERQTLDVITQFVDSNVVEKIIVVSGDDISICGEKDEDRNIKQSVSEPRDQTGELVLGKAELTGSISATKECLTVDHNNSTMEDKLTLPINEADQGHLSHDDDQQNIVDGRLVENITLTGEEKENVISQQANVKVVEDPSSGVLMGKVEKEALLPNDKCLIAKTEDAWYDENDVLDPDMKKAKLLIMDISNEIHEPARFEIPNHVLSSTDIRDSTNDLTTENTQMSKLIANQITDEVNHWKIQTDNLSLKEDQSESLHELSTVTLNSSDPQTTVTLHTSNPQTTGTLLRKDPQSIVTLHSSDSQTTGTLYSNDLQTNGTLHSSDLQTYGTLHTSDSETTGTLLSKDPQSIVTLHSSDSQTTGTLYSNDLQTNGTLHSSDLQTSGTLHTSEPQTSGTLHTSDPQTSGTLHTSDLQTTGTLHSKDPQSIVTLHNGDLQPTGTLHSSDLQTTGTLNTRQPHTSGTLHTSDLQTTVSLHNSDPQTAGTLNTRHPQSAETLHTSYLQTIGTLHSSDPQTIGTLHTSDLQTTETLYSNDLQTNGTLHSSELQTTGTLQSSEPQTTGTLHSSDLQTTRTLHSSDLQTSGTWHSSDLQTTETLYNGDPQTIGTLQSSDPQASGTLHSSNNQITGRLHSSDLQITGTWHTSDPQTTGTLWHSSNLQTSGTLHSSELQTTRTLYSNDLQTIGTLHSGDLQTSGTLHGSEPQTNGTLLIGDPQTTGNLHSSNLQTSVQDPKVNENELLESNNIDTHDSNIRVFLNKLNGDIPDILISDVEKIKNTLGDMSGLNTIYSQEQQNSVEQEQMPESVQHFYLPKSEKHTLEDTKCGINTIKEEEMEASENMEIWVSKLRQFETPEFMKQLREPRQPRSSGLNMCGNLPPIKEDQGSPKSDRFPFRLPIPDIKENKFISEESESTEEPNVAQQTETSEPGEKTYSWERNTERSAIRSSPLELMRKHSGDEVSRSDSYKNFIAQNISQRQSSIIGSLLLSERIDKKTDTSEGKPYSRLESSFFLSSYLKPQNDDQGVTEETQTVSENTSENDTATITTNNTSNSITEKSKQEDNVDSSSAKMDHVTNIDSNELTSELELSMSSPLKTFPDVWHHPEKSHGKLNPRPGKIMLFSEPGFKGRVYEIFSDVGNMCDWKLQGTISVRIIRGGWLLYEKPHYRGKRVMLSEGNTDLSRPWEIQDKSTENPKEDTQKPKSWIGSLRHVVRDFQVPRISLFMDKNGEGNKITILGATADLCVNGQPTKTESIIVHSGLWLVYSKQFFEGDPYILEPGGYPNRKAWNGHDSHLCSLQPARIGGPAVEKPNEPKILLFQHPEFKGHQWEVTKDLHLLQGEPNQQGERLTSVGSLKVFGGCWVAYEKESFHGHQYLLEEGEYQNWSQWGGCTEELGSLRHICTDFSEPEIILYEKPGCLEGSCLRLNEALADIEVAQYGTSTCSVQVLNGVWVAYENVDFSGEQYILEKGIYHNYQDWGAKDSHISSVQPVLQVGGQNLQYLPKIQLFSENNFHGDCMMHTEDTVLLPKTFSPQSCRIEGGSWILYENENCCGEQYILDEGDYPTRTAMGCQAISSVQSLKKVPLYFSTPSISLHGLERFEGKEIEFTSSVRSLQSEGYNNHVLSIKVASGIWVVYEHSDFRGRQWLLERTQITNWLLFSGIQRIGSLCPIRQRRVYFRLRNRALGLFLGVPEPAENMKAARVQVTEPRVGSCNLWYYEEGRIKNQMTPQMSLQVVGMATPGTKVVMWSEGRKPIQTWSLEDSGHIMSCLFEGLCLDIKGGHSYDSDHVVVWETAKDRLTQVWDLEVF
ncbi:beta/gamma crystallin domain-containing protein 2 isoform X2 [Dendrobates tinctorius]|uniref:beta/gamma crystallin domain-containing protein 2 isoform X2 n=1 Tax=Dendrobates tinctorius TaxID=92724 RepID=UPI003CC9266E